MATALVLLLASFAAASNPFSSDVVALTPKNWKEVENSPHAWFINVCRQTWGYCSRLTPEWQKLAGAMKHTVKIAYWDTEQGANPPALIGQIKGTPTIKFIVPHKKNKKNSFKKKRVLDYNGERELGPMKEFAEANMPNFLEKINGPKDLDKFIEKADKYGLPKAIIFTKKASATTKAISTELRRKMLIAEVKGTKNNQAVLDQFKIKDLPKVLVLQDEGEPLELKKKPTYNAMNLFLTKHALKKPSEGPVKKPDPEPEAAKEEL